MRVSVVRKKYPEFFATVEAAVWDDTHMLGRGPISNVKILRRIAYNVAAIATLELHKIASRKKIKMAVKTSYNRAMVPCPHWQRVHLERDNDEWDEDRCSNSMCDVWAQHQ